MKQLLHRDGQPVTLGLPVAVEDLGTVSGVVIRKPEDIPMGKKTADHDGVYELNGGRFFIAAGDELPEGATVDVEELDGAAPGADTAEVVETEERKKGPAPENRAKKAAPEDRSA